MDVLLLLLLLFLPIRNGVRAKFRSMNPFLWGFITVLLMFLGFSIGSFITLKAILGNSVDLQSMAKDTARYNSEVVPQLQQGLANNPIHILSLLLCGFGGYLLTRYIIDKNGTPRKIDIE